MGITDLNVNLYGTTGCGGTGSGGLYCAAGAGVVYNLDTTGKETVLYSFTGGADGGTPNGVIRDAAGNLYGTTLCGGTGTSQECAPSGAGAGVVYKLDTTGKETVLYSFTGGADGGIPEAAVIRDSAGNLYGTTDSGGTSDRGVVFKLDTTGTETVLHSFTGGSGTYPRMASLLRDSAGNLYGTTPGLGARGPGVVFKLKP